MQWKLTGLFILASALTTVLLQTILMATFIYLLFFSRAAFLDDIEKGMQEGEAKALPFFAGATPDRNGLTRMLDQALLTTDSSDEIRFDFMSAKGGKFRAAIADTTGEILASSPDGATFPPGKPLKPLLTPPERALTDAARGGKTNARWIGPRIIAAGPIRRNGTVIAVAFLRSQPLYTSATWGSMVANNLVGLIVSGIATGVVGGVVGYIVSRTILRRLRAISGAADLWGVGDFTATAPEIPGDELGLLGQRLNVMAHDLQQVIGLRNDVAALEERQRITRDLHDTIKQEAFATTMMVGSARQCLEDRDGAGLRRALDEAFDLSRQMQTDLSGILMQLRNDASPAFIERLESIAAAWRRRSGFAVRWQARCAADDISPRLSRNRRRGLSEEAIANAVKHSGGQFVVTLTLERESDAYRLTIADNGVGFDPETARGGMGLGTMRERAALLPNGRLEIGPAEGGGTQVTLYFGA